MGDMPGSPCSLRLGSFIGHPCFGDVCGCHLPVQGKGTGTKVTDLAVAAGCTVCHRILDGGEGVDISKAYPSAFAIQLLRALVETQARLVQSDLILIPDMEIIV